MIKNAKTLPQCHKDTSIVLVFSEISAFILIFVNTVYLQREGTDVQMKAMSILEAFKGCHGESPDPDYKVHGTNMGPTWVLSAPDGPHVGPMNLAIRGVHKLTKQSPRQHLCFNVLNLIYMYSFGIMCTGHEMIQVCPLLLSFHNNWIPLSLECVSTKAGARRWRVLMSGPWTSHKYLVWLTGAWHCCRTWEPKWDNNWLRFPWRT